MDSFSTEEQFVTKSGIPVKEFYTRDDLTGFDPARDLGAPGKPPFTRGCYPSMYRNRPWRIRQLTAFGTVEDERDRIMYALGMGETAVTLLPDMNILYMWDIDHPEIRSRKDDVGLYAPPIHSLRDYDVIFKDIPLDKTYTGILGIVQSMVFSHSCYFALAENLGVPLTKISGTGMNDMHTSYLSWAGVDQIAPRDILRFVGDITEFCVQNAPHWIPISFSGHNIRETGINAYQEIAIILANAAVYIDEVLSRGRLKIDDFGYTMAATHLSSDGDFFEEIAKFRAMRRMWYKFLTERYHATDPHALRLRIHAQSSGASLTYQQPMNNVIRVAYQILAAALGGAQSMNADHFDEAFSEPSEEAALLAIRTQQIAQYETHIMNVTDPLAGSYYVESLTNELEERAWDYLKKIEEQGYVNALTNGWLHREVMQGMMDKEKRINSGQEKVIGVNCFQMEEEPFKIETFRVPPGVYDIEMARLEKLRQERDNARVAQALGEVRRAAETGQNLIRPVIEATKVYATGGEIGQIWRDVFAHWNPPVSIA